jgi:cytochrome c
MTFRFVTVAAVAFVVIPGAWAQGDVARGEEAFRQCAACHSLDAGAHLTGPSLSGVIGRAAGRAPGFRRYSNALKNSKITWTQQSLDQWMANPDKLVPGTSMRIRPLADASMRQDIVAFLQSTQSSGVASKGKNRMPDLKQASPGQRVTGIAYCPDAYRVTVSSGDIYTLWEFNLRFKTDSSSQGPLAGQPVLVGQGMQGDRAQVVFSTPAEIGHYIKQECDDA